MIQVKIPGYQNDLSALPVGEAVAQIIVTGKDLEKLARIMRIVVDMSIVGIHDSEDLGGERPVAREILTGLDQIRRECQIRAGREAVRTWLASSDSYNLHVLTETLKAAGIEVQR